MGSLRKPRERRDGHQGLPETARDVAGVVYAPLTDRKADLEACAARFAEILKEECGAREAGWRLI
ncbi:MAG: hypothetical protein M0C28_25750 [Candidatus Moduliflexus flocculans]|nr:hypothetical protein [Candidatus Moduliflexus flocculans]